MFLHWNGYEIDGSDTDYDIVLPEKEQAVDFINCFLDMPLFTQQPLPKFYCYKTTQTVEEVIITKEQWLEFLVNGKKQTLFLSINCQNANDLSSLLKDKVYSFSGQREPLEKAYGQVDNPCTPPIRQMDLTRGNLTVDLSVVVNGKVEPFVNNELDGYAYGWDMMLEDHNSAMIFTLNCGPSFYYEYAMYIMDYMKEHFPSIGICGGLDCENGWTDGCTYASSLYGLENIQLPVKYSVKNTMRRLMEYNIAIPCKVYYQKGWKWDRVNNLMPAYNPTGDNITKKYLGKMKIQFDEYIELADIITQAKDKNMIYDLALKMILPMSEEFSENKTAEEMLNKTLDSIDEIEDKKALWNYEFYMTFSYNKDQLMCEIRCRWFMKPYVLMLLELMDNGMIEFIKKTTYERRRKQ